MWAGFGYSVELTGKTHDRGRDVIAIKSLHVNERFLIECKRPTRRQKIGVSVVRELYGVAQHERATKGILATTALFTRGATLFVEDHRWELDAKDYDGVLQWIKQYLAIRESHL